MISDKNKKVNSNIKKMKYLVNLTNTFGDNFVNKRQLKFIIHIY